VQPVTPRLDECEAQQSISGFCRIHGRPTCLKVFFDINKYSSLHCFRRFSPLRTSFHKPRSFQQSNTHSRHGAIPPHASLMSLDGEPPCVVAGRRIGAISTPDDPHIILPRRFFPRDQLAQILDRQTALKILECHCQKCHRHATALGKLSAPAQHIDNIVGPPTSSAREPNSSETCISLFGLFIYIGYPQFIISFLQLRSRDIVLETDPTVFTYNTATKYWPRFERHHPAESKELATRFCGLIHQFAVPSMDSGEYSIYGQNTILPFINEERIGTPNEQGEIIPEGSSGNVYAFEIYERYRKFPVSKACKLIASSAFLTDGIAFPKRQEICEERAGRYTPAAILP